MSCHCQDKKIVKSDKAPKAIGPYSVGVIGSHLVFTAGQLGLDPVSQNLVEGGIEAETKQVMTNIKNILEDSGSGLEHIVKTTVIMKDLGEFSKMNAVYGEFFKENPPARTTLQAAALPKGAAVLVEAIAVLPCNCDCEGDCGEDCDCKCHNSNNQDCGCK
jgi:2-iminobutanoate/2-iminopropanoate deaminase